MYASGLVEREASPRLLEMRQMRISSSSSSSSSRRRRHAPLRLTLVENMCLSVSTLTDKWELT